MLDIILLLLSLWSKGQRNCDNLVHSKLRSAPLVPLLQRFQLINSEHIFGASKEVKFSLVDY